jgi:hypothetical protein
MPKPISNEAKIISPQISASYIALNVPKSPPMQPIINQSHFHDISPMHLKLPQIQKVDSISGDFNYSTLIKQNDTQFTNSFIKNITPSPSMGSDGVSISEVIQKLECSQGELIFKHVKEAKQYLQKALELLDKA